MLDMKKMVAPLLLAALTAQAQQAPVKSSPAGITDVYRQFQQPSAQAAPWVLWYWMQAGVSKAGITADLQAMKAAGLGGAYIVCVKGKTNPPLYTPAVEQLTPEWWEMIRFSLAEAARLHLKLGLHVSDGFALAGGPWITPENSMQKLVWSEKIVHGGQLFTDTLPTPAHYKDYYRDVAVYAYPAPADAETNTQNQTPVVTTSIPGADASYLLTPGNNKNFSSGDSCWIQYAFAKPFTCRNITVTTNGTNYQAHRLIVEVSDDGIHFRRITRLVPPRHGWQDVDESVTNAIPAVTARYFRFVYSKKGSEPGAEDLDAAKWKPSLKLRGLTLSGAPRIHQYEGKNGAIWRISERTTAQQLTAKDAIPLQKIISLAGKLDAQGRLKWQVPAGKWCILRVGHTSTGHTNATGGAGIGLECDKFSVAAVNTQFDHWFGEAFRRNRELAQQVLKVFYVDSWECGSQNWSGIFRDEFRRRRGYDILPWLPVMAGVPVESVQRTEKVLYDVRQTIAELVKDVFYKTLADLAHRHDCAFTAESVAPTMMSDGMLHYSLVDIPMSEFWLNSPTHDKPNDMLDATSAAHIYGKNIVQAEAFTTLRMNWNEHPGMMKTTQDRNYALGVNRLVYHVFTHNPWTDRKPGMTLDGVGMYFQRDQTWWKPGSAWVDYARRCQALLQLGKPVADIAVFTGGELPRRAILPDKLVSTLPGIYGPERVAQEAKRLANAGEPVRAIPDGVTHSANMADPDKWVNPLRGYAYDSFNEDALLNLATVRNKRIELPGGAVYPLLVIPVKNNRMPGSAIIHPAVAKKLAAWKRQGLPIIQKPYEQSTFDALGVARDVVVKHADGKHAEGIAWTHRTGDDFDIYFIGNQLDTTRVIQLSVRATGKVPELWNPVTGDTMVARTYSSEGVYTTLPVQLQPNASVFVVLQRKATQKQSNSGLNWALTDTLQFLQPHWRVSFDTAAGGPVTPVETKQLQSWTAFADAGVKYYSGTAAYTTVFTHQATGTPGRIKLSLGKVADMATVEVNGKPCGTAWTAPYEVDITDAVVSGENKLTIQVTNTWGNRIIGDHVPGATPRTWTTAPYRLENKPLQPAGLLGPVALVAER
ncbi:DNA-binding protein [Filimonas zeae]|uniref:DNA-binding protein n=2 Tax=Filimonas zeae TaxID=1737353 RepID=A0A917MRU1_9BACT|nr:DNA-binding protein [Filimonas zeae]